MPAFNTAASFRFLCGLNTGEQNEHHHGEQSELILAVNCRCHGIRLSGYAWLSNQALSLGRSRSPPQLVALGLFPWITASLLRMQLVRDIYATKGAAGQP